MARAAKQRRGAASESCKAAKRKRRAARTVAEGVTLLEGDCFEVLGGLEAESVDAIVTDPPYGIGFKHEHWDSGAISEVAAAAAGKARLSPNEAFGTWSRLWGEQCLRVMKPGAHLLAFSAPRTYHRLACGLEDAGLEVRDTLMWIYGEGMPKSRKYPGGKGTALKPAFEPILLARKSLAGPTTETIERYGTGALNVEQCQTNGRYPANVVVGHEPGCDADGCAAGCAAALLDAVAAEGARARSGTWTPPSRFLFCPKASRRERDAGCEQLPRRALDLFPHAQGAKKAADARNPHPTVKPLELMRWLVRLACPVGGLLLDPFTGSGTTGAAAAIEGRAFCGIEFEASYIEIAAARIAHWAPSGRAQAKTRAPRRPLGRRR